MSVDVACVGPAYLDLIFHGLPSIPGPGEELLAERLVMVPGAMANVAFALARLGLSAVVCAPIGRDAAGRLLADLMAEAGIRWLGRDAAETPVSVAVPMDGDRSFVTVSPALPVEVELIASLAPRAVIIDLPHADRVPTGPRVYGVVGDPEVREMLTRPAVPMAGLDAFIANEREACALTATSDGASAAKVLATRGTTAVVTLGAAGAVAALPDGREVRSAAPSVDARDTTGAGDLFTAAYVWADLRGWPIEDRLGMAATYAALSLGVKAERQKGLSIDAFRQALANREEARSWRM